MQYIPVGATLRQPLFLPITKLIFIIAFLLAFIPQKYETFLFKVQKYIQLSEKTWDAENKVKHKYNYCSLKRKVSKIYVRRKQEKFRKLRNLLKFFVFTFALKKSLDDN